MKETWRWYGEFDKISLSEIAQTGARGIVTALHQVPYGEIWEREHISALSRKIENAGFNFNWEVVESLPVHESIKIGKGNLKSLFKNYLRQTIQSTANFQSA